MESLNFLLALIALIFSVVNTYVIYFRKGKLIFYRPNFICFEEREIGSILGVYSTFLTMSLVIQNTGNKTKIIENIFVDVTNLDHRKEQISHKFDIYPQEYSYWLIPPKSTFEKHMGGFHSGEVKPIQFPEGKYRMCVFCVELDGKRNKKLKLKFDFIVNMDLDSQKLKKKFWYSTYDIK